MTRRLSTSQRAAFAVIAGLTVAAFIAVATGVALFVASPGRSAVGTARTDVTVDLGIPIAAIQVNAPVRVAAPAGSTFRMLDGGGNNHVGDPASSGWFVRTPNGADLLAANSSHLGCLVYFDPPTGDFIDPCGGSVFAADGSVIHGPAAFALSHLAWRQVGLESISVETVPLS